MKIARHIESYRKLFGEIIDALRLSCQSYDKGYFGEAKRLATSVRVLVHDTNTSHSLFEQLGIKRKLAFSSTPSAYGKNNLLAECHLVMALVGPQPTYEAALDRLPFPWQQLPFDGWWSQVVVRDAKGERFSRKDLVLWFANKEGGAHVDPKLDERYRKLQDENSFGFTFVANGAEATPTAGVELACMRQIAHEILCTVERNRKVISKYL